MSESKKKFQVIKRGVKLEAEQPTEESKTVRMRTGVRAGMLSRGSLGCGGPNSCVAVTD